MQDGALRYAVFGHPIAHSLSPRIHQAFARQSGMVLEYAAIDVAPVQFVDGVLAFFGSGGAQKVADTLSSRFGYDVPLLAQIPLDEQVRIGGDNGIPIVDADPDSIAATELQRVADTLSGRARGLAGMQLGLAPAGRL